jgi:predicted nucleic acid-binding protein
VILYCDASALVKRYVIEPGGEDLARWVAAADEVASLRDRYVEIYRAIWIAKLADRPLALDTFERDWADMTVVEVDDSLVRLAGVLAVERRLRSLDALHLAAALTISGVDVRFVAWDHHLRRAASEAGLRLLPE